MNHDEAQDMAFFQALPTALASGVPRIYLGNGGATAQVLGDSSPAFSAGFVLSPHVVSGSGRWVSLLDIFAECLGRAACHPQICWN